MICVSQHWVRSVVAQISHWLWLSVSDGLCWRTKTQLTRWTVVPVNGSPHVSTFCFVEIQVEVKWSQWKYPDTPLSRSHVPTLAAFIRHEIKLKGRRRATVWIVVVETLQRSCFVAVTIFFYFFPATSAACRPTSDRRKYPGSTATVLYYSSLIGCWAVIRAGIMTDTSKEPWEGRKQEKWQWFLFFSGILLSFFCNFWQPADLYGCMLCIILFFFFWKRAWIQLWWRHFCVIKKCWLCHTSRWSFRL